MLEHLKYVFACAALLWLSAVEWKATHHGVLYASVLDDYGMQAGYYEWEFFLLGAHACANHLLYIYSPQVLAYNTTCKPEDTNDMYSNKHLHTGRRLRHPRGALHRAGLCTARALLVLKMKIVVIAYFRACATDRNHGLQILSNRVKDAFTLLGPVLGHQRHTLLHILLLLKNRKYMIASFVRNVVASFYMYSYARYPFIRDTKTVAHTFTQGNVCLLPRSAHGGWDGYLQSMWFTHKYMHTFQADDGPVCRPPIRAIFSWCGFFAVSFATRVQVFDRPNGRVAPLIYCVCFRRQLECSMRAVCFSSWFSVLRSVYMARQLKTFGENSHR